MIERMPTSLPTEDEPKYLTVVNPYPLCATMERFEDQKDFVRWIACCTGKDVLYTIFYKPSVGVVILEVDQHFDGYDRLLGAHRWSEFLKNPSDEERNQVTKIFYCTYTGHGLRATGWKRVEIEEHWFHGWSADDMTSSYPPSSYCEVPPENPTVGPLCRPLPAAFLPLRCASVRSDRSTQRRQVRESPAFAADQKLLKPLSKAQRAKGSPKAQRGALRNRSTNGFEAFTRNNSSTRGSVPMANSAGNNPQVNVPPALKSFAPSLVSGVGLMRWSALITSHSATDLNEDEDEDNLLQSVRSVVPSNLNSDTTPENTSVQSQPTNGTEHAHGYEANDGTPPWSDYSVPREDKLRKHKCHYHDVLCEAGVCEARMTAAAVKRREDERLQLQKEREDRMLRRNAKKQKTDEGKTGGDEDCPWDDTPLAADSNEDVEDAQAKGDQDNGNESSPGQEVGGGKSTTPTVQEDVSKGEDATFNGDGVDPCTHSPKSHGDEAGGVVSSVERAANSKECSNSSTPWDNLTPGPNVNSSSGYLATDNEFSFAPRRWSGLPSSWDAPGSSGAGLRVASVVSRSGWAGMSKDPW